MKIVQINAVYKYSSTGRNVYETHEWLKEHGHESYVFWATENTAEEVDEYVISVGNKAEHKLHALLSRIVGDYGYGSVFSTLALCKKLNDIAPDVVHLHNLHSNYVNLPILFRFLSKQEIPTVITLHDCWFFTGGCMYFGKYGCDRWQQGCVACPVWKTATKRLKKKAELFGQLKTLSVIGVSQWIVEEARKTFLGQATFSKTIYNWLDFDVFYPHEHKEQSISLHKDGKGVLLFVAASWVPTEKGIEDIRVMADSFPEDLLVVIGKGTESLDGTENIIRIPFTNSSKELAQYYSVADVFVNPSRMETFGKVTAEAMACGTPVVVYGNTGTKELCESGCGEIAVDGDIADLISKTKKVLTNGKKYYADRCATSARERFSLESAMKQHIEIYEQSVYDRKDKQ